MDEIDLVVGFLRDIGFRVEEDEVAADTFLPGIVITQGALRFDPAGLLSAGDLLHEAGHLALLPPADRERSNGVFEADGGYEMGAIAWSYAASVHLALPIASLFHDGGYRGGAEALRDNFSAGRYVGVPMLAWRGLLEGDTAINSYPKLKRWLAE
jgi:hypothetical protein